MNKIQIDPNLAPMIGEMFAVVDPEEYRLDSATELLLQGVPDQMVDQILRGDASGSSSTPYTRDELVHVLSTIYEQKYAKNTVQEAFGIDNELKPGALTYRIHRIDTTGEPELIGDGGRSNDAPELTLTNDFEDFPIDYYRLDVTQSYLENLAETNMGRIIKSRARKMQKAREAFDRYVDKRAWRHALNNPYVPLWTTTQKFGVNQTALDVYKDLRKMIGFPINNLQGEDARKPVDMWVSPRMEDYIMEAVTDTDRNHTIMDEILKRSSIRNIKSSPRLQDIGGTNIDGVVLLPPGNPMALKMALPMTTLPMQRTGLVNRSINVGGDGGLCFVDSLGSVVGLYEYEE